MNRPALGSVLLVVGTALATLLIVGLAILRPPIALGIGGAAFLLVLAWFCDGSVARAGSAGLVLAIGIPVIPGFQEQRQPQLIAVSLVFAVLLFCVLVQANRRGVRNSLALWVLFVPVGLALITVGLDGFDSFRLLLAISASLVLSTAIAVGKTANARELEALFKMATAIAIIASGLAVIEYVRQSPVYEFTAFQIPGNTRSAFRASAVFGHPLVLSTFMVSVATLNLARPIGSYPWWFRSKILTVLVPLVGAAASVSRSAFVLVAAGFLAILIMRNEGQIKARRKGFVLLLAAAAGVSAFLAIGSAGAFGDRFAELSTESQFVRLNGLAVVSAITTGVHVLIGGGPRSVAEALMTNHWDITLGTTDNQFLDTYADYGLIGAGVLVILALVLLRAIRKRGLGGWQRAAAIGAIPILAGFFILDPLAWYSLAVLFGVGVGAATMEAAAPEQVTSAGGRLSAQRM